MPRRTRTHFSRSSGVSGLCASDSDDSDASDEFALWWDREHICRTHVACPHSPGMFAPLVVQALVTNFPQLAHVEVNPPKKEEVWGAMEPLNLRLILPDDADWYLARPCRDALYVFDSNSWTVASVRRRAPLPSGLRTRSTEEAFLNACRHRAESGVAPCTYTPLSDVNPDGTESRPHHFHHFSSAVPYSAVDPAQMNPDVPTPHWALKILPTALDLYICCVCSTHVLMSNGEHIPGIVPVELLDKLRAERAAIQKGGTGESPEDRIVQAVAGIIAIVQNVLWRGVMLDVKNDTPHFRQRIGHTSTVQRIFESLQFTWEPELLRPPQVKLDSKSETTREVKTLLLRAWVELRAWLSEYRDRYGSRVRRPDLPPFVVTQNAVPILETAIGASEKHFPRSSPPGSALVHEDDCWLALGLTQDTFSPDIIRLAYNAQLRCDPYRTPFYYNHLKTLFNVAYDEEDPRRTQALRRFLQREGARHRWDAQDLQNSLRALGFNVQPGQSQPRDFDDLHISVNPKACLSKVHEALFESAFKHAMCLAENAGTNSENAGVDIPTTAVRRAELRGALNTVAEHIGSYKLKELSRHAAKWQPMSVFGAYELLGVSRDADDDVLVSTFKSRIAAADDVHQMREAFEVVAHARGSPLMRKFIAIDSNKYECKQRARRGRRQE